jgi:biotin synthase
MSNQNATAVRHDWTPEEVTALFTLPFNDLMFQAQTVHRQNFDANEVQISTLLSIKTGACPEDCKYCPQSGHYNTGLEKEKLMEIQRVIEEAKAARDGGASRFCMGAAWRSPTVKQMPYWIITTTISIRRRSITKILLPHGLTRTVWIRYKMCAIPA